MPLTKVKSGGVSDSITLASPDINAPDIDGGTIDNAVIGGATAAAGSFTTITATGGSSSNWNTAYGWGDHSTQSYATQTYVGTAVSNLVDSSPAALDTLNELAAALGDDPNFATTVTNSIALKAPLASPSFTGTATITQSGNNVGLLVTGGGYNYTAKFESSDAEANIIIEDSNSTNNGNMIGVATNDMYFITNTVERLRIESGGGISTYPDASGTFVINENGADADFRVESNDNTHMLFVDGGANQVVVGTSSPITGVGAVMTLGGLTDTRLVIDGSSSSGLYLTDSGAQGITMRNASGDLEFYGVANKEFAFNENGIDTDFRVESDGYSHMLFVDAGANIVAFGRTQLITGGGMYFNHSNATKSHLVVSNTETSYSESLYYGNRQNSDGQVFQFRRQNYTVGSISVDSNGTTYNTTSDLRLKKDIETITDGTDKLMAMNPVTHGWKTDPEADTVHGFIAQEMLDIVPEAVSGDPESDDMMSMDYGRITPVLVAALQDAHKKIAGLETRLNELEGK